MKTKEWTKEQSEAYCLSRSKNREYNDMKTNRKYTMSSMKLVNENWNITATFQGDKTYEGRLWGLALWAKIENVGVLRSCTIEGERHGLFPCIVARDPRVAAALSVFSGYEIAMGDGRSFFTRKDALLCYKTLLRAGIPITPECLVWAVSELPYDSPKPKQPELPLAESTEEASKAIFG